MPKREKIHRRIAKSFWKLVEVQIFFWVSILSGGTAIMKHSLADASKSKDKTLKTAIGKVYYRGIENFVFERPLPENERSSSASENRDTKLPSSAIEKGADSFVSIASVENLKWYFNLDHLHLISRCSTGFDSSLEGYYSSISTSGLTPINLRTYLIPLRT